MRITARDVRLVKDISLSHVMSRDQIISCYFSSVTRANSRLRALRKLGFVSVLPTPFFDQFLYTAGPKAEQIVGDGIRVLLAGRTGSPRFLQHGLAVTNARLRLAELGMTGWRFEQQARVVFPYATREYEVRPDGLAVMPQQLVAVEVDLGHVAPAKFKAKLSAYNAFVASGACAEHWRHDTFRLLTLTTGRVRAARLSRLTPVGALFEHRCVPFDQFGAAAPGGWS